MMTVIKRVSPILVFILVASFFAVGLTRDPAIVPSALLDKPVPEFSLPGITDGDNGLSHNDLNKGLPTLVNVWASWCAPCRIEHPLIKRLAQDGMRVIGINYRDNPTAAQEYLASEGDPYQAIGFDKTGRVGIDWGVYGVPETYLVDGAGIIRYKHVGPLTNEIIMRDILPLYRHLEAQK